MTFRELFWAHLTHKEMKWQHITFLVSFAIVFAIMLIVWVGAQTEKQFQPSFLLGFLGYLLVSTYQNPLFYTLAKVSAELDKPGKDYWWNASWPVYLSQLILLMSTFTGFLYLSNNQYWSVTLLFALPIFVVVAMWRYFTLKTGSGPSAQSHFKGHKHHSSKTIR